MRIRAGVSSIAIVAISAMTMVAFSPLASTAGAHATTEKSTCRGSALRLKLFGTTILEPTVVQNAAGKPCTAQTKTLVGPIDLLGIHVEVGSASTTISGTANHPVTTAQVAGLNIATLSGLITIGADVIRAQSSAGSCSLPFGTPTSKPALTSNGLVANLKINGQPIDIGNGPVHIDVLNLGLVFIDINQVNTVVVPPPTGTYSITRTALKVSVPALGTEVVLAEAQSGFIGHPCDHV